MLNGKLSRRRFLRLALLGGIGVQAAMIHRQTQPVGVANFLRWSTRGHLKRLEQRPSVVSLGQCATYDGDVLECLRDLWHQADMPDVSGKRILIKPNIIDIIEDRPVTTDSIVIAAVLDLLTELGAGELAVGDGSGFRREAWPLVEQTGLASLLAARKVPFVDLNYDDPAPVPARDGWFLHTKEIWLPRHVREADLIVSVPKLKCHHWTGVSLGMKNLFGVVPGARYGWPKNMLHVNGIPLSICGLYQSVGPMITIVDGIVGMEGDGPLFGAPVKHGLLAVGSDSVAVDATCVQQMGFTPEDVDYLLLAQWAGLGQSQEVELRGTSADVLRRQYQWPPNLV